MSALEGLRLAAQWQGTLLSGEGGPLLLVERVREHTGSRLALYGRRPEDLASALEVWSTSDVNLNLVGLVPLAGTELPAALAREAHRIGALLGALDLSQATLGIAPHLVRRMPGMLDPVGQGLDPLPLTSIQAFELRRYAGGSLPDWSTADHLWWEGPAPAKARVIAEPLTLPTATPFVDALRSALRARTPGPVDFLPLPGDPRPLHALRRLTPNVAVFPCGSGTWADVLGRLAKLPAPAHFCARC